MAAFSAGLAPSLPLIAAVRPPPTSLAFFIASAISFVVNLLFKEVTIDPLPGNFSKTSLIFTISIPVCGELTARFAISSESQKNPLPPLDCTSVFLRRTSSKYAAVLATADKFVIALNIEYLGSSISPYNSLKTLEPLPFAFSKLFIFVIAVVS